MMTDESKLPAPGGQFLVYQTEDGKLKIDVRFEGETVWLTQQHMAALFQTTQQNVSLHIQSIYEEGELEPAATHKKYLSVRMEGSRQVRRSVDFYNLDMIISVGYRVKSVVATRFRIWATQRLREYIVKGFVLDDERLKNPDLPSGNADLPIGSFDISGKVNHETVEEENKETARANREIGVPRKEP